MKRCSVCSRKFEDSNTFCPYDGRELVSLLTQDIIGRLIDNKYLIENKIARGGTGTVYKAMHVQLNVSVAVKVLHTERMSDALAVERFRREAYAAMQVRHPNAIAVFDFGVTTDNLVYVVMELLRGMSLRQKLKQMCYVSLLDVNSIIQQISAAVAIAHKRKIVHRDLKPENVFIHNDGDEEIVKVVDFGLAKLRGFIDDVESPALTRDGLVIGTPLYMSPEQSRGRSVDKRSDIYSLGVMLYEMLTGTLPFRGSSLSEIAIKHATEKPRPVYEIRPVLPAVINAVVMHALEKVPKNRPSTVTEWAASLHAAVKAVTEGQFRDLFINASDEDLEAAILLTGEMDQLRISSPGIGEAIDLGNETGSHHFQKNKQTNFPNNQAQMETPFQRGMPIQTEGLINSSSAMTLGQMSLDDPTLDANSTFMEESKTYPQIPQEDLPMYIFTSAQDSMMVLQAVMTHLAAQHPLNEDLLKVIEKNIKDMQMLVKQAKNLVTK
ncbi:MAG: serine/threonine protein kinase [Acidobacteria bacterium]|nr:serine/threonine protein kinase [Acidobacteriota bacterium]